VDDPLRGEFAKALLKAPPPPSTEPVKYHQWGEGLEHEAVMQMEKACLLPVSVAGALMPDAHVGYGLGHESMETTQMYLHANLELKEQALAKTQPFKGRLRRYRPTDQLLAFLQGL
jgi:hypothetical protein